LQVWFYLIRDCGSVVCLQSDMMQKGSRGSNKVLCE
jgi:hypothetical protein